MKVKAPESETVSRSLRRAGLTDKQIRARLNRALLCLDHIGNGERISVEVFECFSGQLKVNGDRLRFNQVLRGAGLIRETRPAIQGLCSAEYKCRGKSIEQEIKLNREEAQIPRKIKATRRKAEKADKTLQWLNKATKHSLEGGCYLMCPEKSGHEILLQRGSKHDTTTTHCGIQKRSRSHDNNRWHSRPGSGRSIGRVQSNAVSLETGAFGRVGDPNEPWRS